MREVNRNVDVSGFRDPIRTAKGTAKGPMSLEGAGIENWLGSELDKAGASTLEAYRQKPELTESLGMSDSRYQVGLTVWATGLKRPYLEPADLEDPAISRDLALGVLSRKLPIHQMKQVFFPLDFDEDLSWMKDQLGDDPVAKVVSWSRLRTPVYEPAMLMHPETHELYAVMDGATLNNQPMPFQQGEVPPALVINVRTKTDRDKQINKLEHQSDAAAPWVLTVWLEGGKYSALNFDMTEKELDDRFTQGIEEVERCLPGALEHFQEQIHSLEKQIDNDGLLATMPERNIAGQLLSVGL